jgi:hypothetical protein
MNSNRYNGLLVIGAVLVTIFFGYLVWKSYLLRLSAQEDYKYFLDVTSLLIGFAGAALVYLSLKAQITANQIQFSAINQQRELDLIYRFYEEVKNDLLRMQPEYGKKYGQHSILDSYMEHVFQDQQKDIVYPEFHLYMKYTITSFKFLCNRVKRRRYTSASETIYIIEKVQYLFELYFGRYQNRLFDTSFQSAISIEVVELFTMIRKELSDLETIRVNCKAGVSSKRIAIDT